MVKLGNKEFIFFLNQMALCALWTFNRNRRGSTRVVPAIQLVMRRLLLKYKSSVEKNKLIFKVTVISAPEMRDPEKEELHSLNAGDTLILQCPLVKNAPPLSEVRWFLNDAELTSDRDGILLSEDRRRLRVDSAQAIHSGHFKCLAENVAGEAEKHFRVDVLLAPRMDLSVWPTVLRLEEGQQVEFGCPVNGIPIPNIVWLLNTHQVLEAGADESSTRGVQLFKDRVRK